ncbi:MAG: hypothetical protein AAF653_08345 [Chloroflexota bacterium]
MLYQRLRLIDRQLVSQWVPCDPVPLRTGEVNRQPHPRPCQKRAWRDVRSLERAKGTDYHAPDFAAVDAHYQRWQRDRFHGRPVGGKTVHNYQTTRTRTQGRTCKQCGKALPKDAHPAKLYCDAACRVAYNTAKKAA